MLFFIGLVYIAFGCPNAGIAFCIGEVAMEIAELRIVIREKK